jgi:hypothetical protein
MVENRQKVAPQHRESKFHIFEDTHPYLQRQTITITIVDMQDSFETKRMYQQHTELTTAAREPHATIPSLPVDYETRCRRVQTLEPPRHLFNERRI